MENSDPKPVANESKTDRTPTPGGMYRRAEMRAHAESLAVAGAITQAPVELPADVPVASVPEVVPVLGHVDPIVQAIAPLPDISRRIARRPPISRGTPTLRGPGPVAIGRRYTLVAAGAASLIAILWLAWPNTPAETLSSVTATGPVSSRAHDDAIPKDAGIGTTPQAVTAAQVSTQAAVPVPPSTSAEPAPRAAVTDPVLRITSDPAGARVTVDGVGWGATPVVVRHLPPGAKRVRVTKDGYVANERVVSLSGPTTIQLRLRRRPGEAVLPAAAKSR